MKNLTNEMLQKAKECKTVEELLNLAKENGYPLTEEDATAKFNEWHKTGELADEELNNVSGGGCLSSDDLYVGRNVGLWNYGTIHCETCGSERYIVDKVTEYDVELRCVNNCANVYCGNATRFPEGATITD